MSKIAAKPPANELYEADFYAWTQEQARLLRERRWDDLDLANLVDEVESVGRGESGRSKAASKFCWRICSNGSFSRAAAGRAGSAPYSSSGAG